MPSLKLGNRVTVRRGVSPCRDGGSLQLSRRLAAAGGRPDLAEDGVPRGHFVGMRGEVVQIGKMHLDVKDGLGRSLGETPSDVPPGCEEMVLVDSQVVNGARQGRQEMREWFLPDELEVG